METEETNKIPKRKIIFHSISLVIALAVMLVIIVYRLDLPLPGSNINVTMSSNERLSTAVEEDRGLTPIIFIGSITVTTEDSGLLVEEDFYWLFDTFNSSRSFKKFDFSGAKVENNTIPDEALALRGEESFTTDKLPLRNLKEVYMPDSITSIGESAFSNCENLTKCDLPDGLTEIKGSSFFGCENLIMEKLPQNTTYIGDSAFWWCGNITIKELPENLTYIGDNAFAMCQSIEVSSLPTGLSFLGGGAFTACGSIGISEIPEKIESLGFGTFSLSSIEKMFLNERLRYIDDGAFRDCYALENVIFQSKTPPEIEKDAFANEDLGSSEYSLNIYYPNTWEDVPQALEIAGIKLIEYDIEDGVPIDEKENDDETSSGRVRYGRGQ